MRGLCYRAAPAALFLLLLAGCSTNLDSLNFRTDKRLRFLSPGSRQMVQQPVRLSWTIRDFTIAAIGEGPMSKDRGYFAIFIDQAPIQPGQTLKAIGKGDPSCEHSPSCPDAAYLAARQIYTTTKTSFTLPTVANIAGLKDLIQLHEATIVLLDTGGHRIGESAWFIDFKLRKGSLS